jgi:hypothetical protein
VRRRKFISLFGGVAAVWSLAAHAEVPPKRATKATPATLPHIEMVRVVPVDREPPSPRLSDSLVDLLKDFSLSSSQGVGGAWKIPPYIAISGDTFDKRYGEW